MRRKNIFFSMLLKSNSLLQSDRRIYAKDTFSITVQNISPSARSIPKKSLLKPKSKLMLVFDILLNFSLTPNPAAGCQYTKRSVKYSDVVCRLEKTTNPQRPFFEISLLYSDSK